MLLWSDSTKRCTPVNAKENMRILLTGGPCERVGFHDAIWADTLSRWVGEGYPTRDGAPEDPVDALAFDIVMIGGIDPMPFCACDEIVEESAEWTIRRNGAGACHKYWKRKSGAPEHVSFDLTSRDVWDRKYRGALTALDVRRIQGKKVEEALLKARKQELFFSYHNAFLWENLRESMGDVCMLESMCLDPGWILDFNRVYTDFYKSHYRYLFETYGLPDGISISEDMAYNKGLFCSVRLLASLFLPYFSELVAFFHSFGLSVTIHSDGDLREAIPLLIEAGFDAINPMENKAGCDPLLLAERYASKLAFKGGLDARILESGDRDMIKQQVTRLVRGMKERGARYIFGSDHSVSTNVSYADYCYATEIYRENMEYATSAG
jgi:hypothetical protein